MKKYISLILVILFIVTIFPAGVFSASGEVRDNLWTLDDEFMGMMYFHIPQVEWPDGMPEAQINKTIMDIYGEDYYDAREKLYDGDSMTYPGYNNVAYSAGDNGKILSVAVKRWYSDSSNYTLNSYHMDIKTGRELSHEDVVLEYGYTWDEFINLSGNVLVKCFENRFSSMKDDPGYDFALNLTKKKENYSQSVPYINAEGELCVLGWVGSLAGAGKYLEIVNIATKDSEETIYYQAKTQDVYTFDIGEVPQKPVGKTGDVNGDGKINALDATQILRYANNKPSVVKNLEESGKDDLADVNSDGRINALDATQILRYANNKPSSITK